MLRSSELFRSPSDAKAARTAITTLRHKRFNFSSFHRWVRTSVPGQMATGAFMKITSKDGARLVSASSPVAGVTEVHEMKMDGGVMKMRALQDGLDLPAGKTVELKPGGYHVMLMDLKSTLTKNGTVPLTLVFKDAKGVESRVELKLPVATAPVHSH